MLLPIRIGCIAAAVVLASVMVSCSNDDTSPTTTATTSIVPSQTTPSATEPINITWSFWGDPWEVKVNQRVVSVFNADYPGIHVELLHEPWTTYFDKVEEWWESDDVPDVTFLEYIPLYAARGLLENLDPYIQQDNFDINDFYPALIDSFRYKGAIYGLPRDNDTKVIFYNKTLFDAAGLAYPASGWTWEDLRHAAIGLTRQEDDQTVQYGFAYEPDDWWRLWVWQNGGEVYDDDFAPTRTLIKSPEAIEAIQWLADMTNIDGVTPPYEVQRTSLEIGRLFQEGKLAMAFGNHALLPGFAATPGLEWDVVGLPEGKIRVNVAGGAGYAITSESKAKEAAWTFLEWLESPKGQAIFTETGVAVPARRSVGQADIFLKQNPSHNAAVFLEETELGRANPIFENVQTVTRVFNEAFAPVWKGEKGAGEAIEEVVPVVDALLGEH